MEASGQFHAPVALTSVNTYGSNEKEARWDPQLVRTMWRKKKKSLALPQHQNHYTTTISQVPQTTDRPAPEMLVPRYTPVHTVPHHTKQSSQ